MRCSAAVMISATPALSSAPSSVVPSVWMSVWPTKCFSSGNSSGVMASWPLRRISPPSYSSTMRGFTPAPLMSGEVSTWAMKPITGAFSQPGVAGIVPIT